MKSFLLFAVLALVGLASFDVPRAEACGGRDARVERRQDRRATRQERRQDRRDGRFSTVRVMVYR